MSKEWETTHGLRKYWNGCHAGGQEDQELQG